MKDKEQAINNNTQEKLDISALAKLTVEEIKALQPGQVGPDQKALLDYLTKGDITEDQQKALVKKRLEKPGTE